MAVDPAMATGIAGPGDGFAAQGSEWGVGGIGSIGQDGAATAPVQESGTGFGDLLSGQIQKLSSTQQDAANASASLADGTATDVSSVVMAVERAKLSMQLASQVRNKAVEAYQEVFRTQV